MPVLTAQDKLERLKIVGGSDVPNLYNMQPWYCRKKLWLEKTGQQPDWEEFHDDNRFERGHDIEIIAAPKYAEKTGFKVFMKHKVATIKGKPHCGVHIDRHIVSTDDGKGPGVLEIKNMASKFQFNKLSSEGVYDAYITQLQWAMHVTGWKWGAFVIFCSDTWDWIEIPVEYDPIFGAELEAKVDAFWEEVQGGVDQEPLPDKDKRCLKCNFRTSCKGDFLLTSGDKNARDIDFISRPDMDEIVADWIEADEISKEASDHLEMCKMKIKDAAGDDQEIAAGGQKIYYRESSRKSVDPAMLARKYPEIKIECTKTTPVRNLKKYPA